MFEFTNQFMKIANNYTIHRKIIWLRLANCSILLIFAYLPLNLNNSKEA